MRIPHKQLLISVHHAHLIDESQYETVAAEVPRIRIAPMYHPGPEIQQHPLCQSSNKSQT